MGLRRTTLLVIGFTFAGLLALLFFSTRNILLSHVEREEERSILVDLDRTEQVLENEYTDLEQSGTNLAAQPAVLTSLNQNQPTSFTFSGSDLRILRANFLLVFDSSPSLVYSAGWDLENETELQLPDSLEAALAPGSAWFTSSANGKAAHGILPGSPSILLTIQPIYSPSTGNLVIGYLGLGRLLTSSELTRLSSQVRLQVNILPLDDPGLGQIPQVTAENNGRLSYPLDANTIAGYALLNSADGQPDAVLQILQSRSVYQNGTLMINYVLTFLVAAVVVFSIIIILLLQAVVLAPVSRLSREVNELGLSGDLSLRVRVSGKDELARLGVDINHMLAELQHAQIELRQQVEQLQTLHGVSQAFLNQSDLTGTLTETCRLAVSRFGMLAAWAGRISSEGEWLRPVAAEGMTGEVVSGDPWLSADGLIRRAVQSRQAVISPVSLPGLPAGAAIQAAVFPILRAEEPLAVVIFFTPDAARFEGESLHYLQAFINLVGLKTQSALLFVQANTAQQRLQTLSHRLVQVQEEERRSIAQELHDEIGQTLTGLKLLLDTLPSPAGSNDGAVGRARLAVNDLIGRVRQMSLDLRPAMLDDLGLLPALIWLFDRYTAQTRIQVHFSQSGLENHRFNPEIEITAYRVVQEALTNVARYAGVNEVHVSAFFSAERLSIQVEDEGSGFELERALSSGQSRGLLGMRERVRAAGGDLWIDTAPGKGTSISLHLPAGESLAEGNA